jgi:glutaredoxin
MKQNAVFYHAGCPVCVSAERGIESLIDRTRYDLSIVHLGTERGRLPEAERSGVKSVPALVVEGQVYHINHGADLTALKE